MSCDDAGTNEAQRIEIFTGAGKRWDWRPEVNVSISYSGQDSISAVARRYAMCPSQLFTWHQELRKEMEAQGLVPPATSAAAPLFVPAVVERAVPTLIAAREVLERFHSLIRLKDTARLDPWIVTAARTKLAAFAAGVDADRHAVAAAISTPWSSGQVEGTICRLKSSKRHMYGRAKLDLPRGRIMTPAGASAWNLRQIPSWILFNRISFHAKQLAVDIAEKTGSRNRRSASRPRQHETVPGAP